MTEYEKSPRRTNYYQNNGFDGEQWEDWDYDTNYPTEQEDYHGNHHYHSEDRRVEIREERRDDDVFEDHHHRLEEERFQDDKADDCQEADQGGDPNENINADFEKNKSTHSWDDKFEQFKNGPFPKK